MSSPDDADHDFDMLEQLIEAATAQQEEDPDFEAQQLMDEKLEKEQEK